MHRLIDSTPSLRVVSHGGNRFGDETALPLPLPTTIPEQHIREDIGGNEWRKKPLRKREDDRISFKIPHSIVLLLLAELHLGFALFSVSGATADPDSPLARPLLCGRRDRPLVRHLRRREQHPTGEDGPHQARRAALLCRHRGSFRYISIAEIEKVIGLSVCLQAFVCSLIAPFIDDTDREGECDFELSGLLLHRT